MTGKRILIAENDMNSLSFIYMTLMQKDYILEATNDAAELLPRIERFNPDLMLINKHLPYFNAEEFCILLKETFDIPFILIAERNTKPLHNINGCTPDDVFQKPINKEALLQKINLLLTVQ